MKNRKLIILTAFLSLILFQTKAQAYLIVSDGNETEIQFITEEDCTGNGEGYYWHSNDESCVKKDQAAIVWRGFSHKWDGGKNTPHRLNGFASYFKNVSFTQNESSEKGSLNAERVTTFSVGEYEDTAFTNIKSQYVRSSVLHFYNNSIDESELSLEGEVGDQESYKKRIQINLEDIGFENDDDVSVFLRGFSIDEHDVGFTTRGFGVRVIPVSLEDKTFIFDILVKIHPEGEPSRKDEDKYYRYDFRVYYTVVGTSSENGSLINAPSSGTNTIDDTVSMYPYKTPDWISESERSAVIHGEEGFDSAFVAIQGFEWHLGEWDTDYDGRYIRELDFYVSDFEYESSTGKATFLTNGYFSNEGAWPYGFDLTFTSWNLLVQVNDPRFKRSELKTYDDEFDSEDTQSVTSEVDYEF